MYYTIQYSTEQNSPKTVEKYVLDYGFIGTGTIHQKIAKNIEFNLFLRIPTCCCDGIIINHCTMFLVNGQVKNNYKIQLKNCEL